MFEFCSFIINLSNTGTANIVIIIIIPIPKCYKNTKTCLYKPISHSSYNLELCGIRLCFNNEMVFVFVLFIFHFYD